MTAPNPGSVFGNRRNNEASVFTMSTQSPEDVTEFRRDDEATRARRNDMQLGNHELPIADYREQIVDAVDNSQVTIITAETGAGKSTQVPQFLAEEGYEVIVTQPRIVAARTLSERVRDEIVDKKGLEYADFVGYRTARERNDNPDNQMLFVTDGLQLVRELSGDGAGKKQILVLDEVHEWNENMEVLVAWAKKHMREDLNFKVAVMSATMEADKLAKYFVGDTERKVPIVEVPGRTYEVKKSEGGDVATETIRLAKEGKNTLVFVPGKAEIEKVMADVERARVPGTVVLPLHGQLDKDEQKKVFQKYDGAKIIVATNVAQTSITIDDIDAVVDSGLERQNRVKNGVEGLYLNPISQADCMQRAGRAGRTKEGEYVLAQLDDNKFASFDEREPYGTPEILRTRLDGTVLRLAKAGFDASKMDFYNVSSRGEGVRQQFEQDVLRAKERLQKLGALTENGNITTVGRQMDRMPLESHYARMMVEARKYSPEVRQQLAAMLAAQESGGLTIRGRNSQNRWTELISGDTRSDMIVELEVMIAAQKMSYKDRKEHDVMNKNFSNAQNIYRQLRRVDSLPSNDLSLPTKKEREQLVKCIAAGMVDNLYINEGGSYVNNGDERSLSDRRVVGFPDMVVGVPFDLQIQTRRGAMTLHLVESVTEIPSVDMLREVAPQLFAEKPGEFVEMRDSSVLGREYNQLFNGQDTGKVEVREAEPTEERRNAIIENTLRSWPLSSVYQGVIHGKEVTSLRQRVPSLVKIPTTDDIREILQQTMPISVSSFKEGHEYLPDITIDDIVSPSDRAKIEATSPLEIGGVSLRYREGMPYIGDKLSDDSVLALNSADFVLSDGRAVRVEHGWSRSSTILEYQVEIREKREREAEEELENHRRHVKESTRLLLRGYTDRDDVEQEYGKKVADEAYEQCEKTKERLTNVQQKGETVARELDATLLGIDINNDNIPDDIVTEVDELKNNLSDLVADIGDIEQRVAAGNVVDCDVVGSQLDKFRVRIRDLVQYYNKWKEQELKRETQRASASDIAQLAQLFNS